MGGAATTVNSALVNVAESEESTAVIVYEPTVLIDSPPRVTTPATAVSRSLGPGWSDTLPGLASSDTETTSFEPGPVSTTLP